MDDKKKEDFMKFMNENNKKDKEPFTIPEIKKNPKVLEIKKETEEEDLSKWYLKEVKEN